MRRIHNKIYVEPVSREAFQEILARALAERGIACEAPAAASFTDLCLQRGGTLKACYPADLGDILMWRSQYDGRPPILSGEELDRAADLYFTRGTR